MPEPATFEPNTAAGGIMNVRKLAALDIVFHGPRLIVLEFGAAVLGLVVLGGFTLIHALAPGQHPSMATVAIGAYFLSLALNYLPLLVYAVAIARIGSAESEVANELKQRGQSARKYGIQQLLLLVPLAVLLLAIAQEIGGRNRHAS